MGYHRSNSFLNQNFNQPPNYNFHNQNKNNKYYQNQPSTHQSIFNNNNHIEQPRSATLNRRIGRSKNNKNNNFAVDERIRFHSNVNLHANPNNNSAEKLFRVPRSVKSREFVSSSTKNPIITTNPIRQSQNNLNNLSSKTTRLKMP